jgi:hypothetical protein
MNKEKSDWRTIHGYTDYQINQFGEVKSLRRGKERILKPFLTCKVLGEYRYYAVKLCNKIGPKKFYVHRLMAMTFLNYDSNNKNLVIDHINNNSFDNNLENIQVITQRKNKSKDRINKTGFTGVKKSGIKYEANIYINKKCIYLGIYPTPEEAGQAYQDYLSKLNEA